MIVCYLHVSPSLDLSMFEIVQTDFDSEALSTGKMLVFYVEVLGCWLAIPLTVLINIIKCFIYLNR